MRTNGTWLGFGGALGATLAWGGMFPVFGVMLRYLDPVYLMAIRYAGAGLLLVALVVIVEGPRALRFEGRGRLLLALGLGGIGAFNVLIILGVHLSGPSHGALIMAMTPLLAAVVAWVRSRRRPESRTLFFIALAFAGVALVVTRGSLANLAGGSGAGDAMILLGAFLWAVYTVVTPRFSDWSPLRFSALTAAIGGAGIAALAIVLTGTHVIGAPSAHALAVTAPGMAYIIVLGVVFAIVAWNVGVKHLGSQRTVLFMNVVPITTFAIEVLLGKHFSAVEYTGAAFTIAALIGNNVFARAPQAGGAPSRVEAAPKAV